MNDSIFPHLNIAPPTQHVDLEARSLVLIHEQKMAYFRNKCPLEFQKPIDRALIPNLTAWDAADAWQPGEYPGLWLWSSETGRAKTRMQWRKIGQAHVRLNKRHVFITGAHLGEWCYTCFRDGEPSEFYRRFRNHDLVVLDDVDKYPFGDERHARAFRELFDFFYSSHISVLVSANESIAAIGAKIGDSGRRRIEEVCREVRF